MNREYPARPLIGVAAIVFRGPRVLLIRRGQPPRQGQWSLPGGLQELGETVFAAARREVREETGLAVTVHAIIDVVDLIEHDGEGGTGGPVRYHYTLIEVLASAEDGTPRPGGDAEACAWADADDLDGFRLWSETERVIRLANQRRRALGLK